MNSKDQFSISSLKKGKFVLGEYTTSAGPYADDHFIVIAMKPDSLLEFPVASPECKEIIHYIQRTIDSDVRLALSNSTEFQSHILYPRQYLGKPFFTVQTDDRETWPSILMRMLGRRGAKYVVSPLVMSYMDLDRPGNSGDPFV